MTRDPGPAFLVLFLSHGQELRGEGFRRGAHLDDRLEQLLANMLGGDCVAATFDHVVTGTGQASCFDITTSTMDVPDSSCKHVAVSSPATCPYDTLVVDPRDYENERADDARRAAQARVWAHLPRPGRRRRHRRRDRAGAAGRKRRRRGRLTKRTP